MTKHKMTPERIERLEWYARGYVTVGTVSQVEEKSIRRYYVGKLRGNIVADTLEDGEMRWRFDTEEEAREHGKAWRERCREELSEYFATAEKIPF